MSVCMMHCVNGVKRRFMMKHYTHDNWLSWLEQLSSPLTDIPCGEDLKYDEDFKYLKSSFSGVNELDCKKIFIIGTKLSAEKSKDLRIVSYVLLAAAGEYGVEGLTNGFALFNALAEHFFTEVHPLKDKVRKGVHTWMLNQQDRMVALTEQAISKNEINISPKGIILLQEQLAIYGEKTARKIDDNAGPLSDLAHWANKLSKKYPVVIEKEVLKESINSQNDVKATTEVTAKLSNDNNIDVDNNANQTIQHTPPITRVEAIETDTQFTNVLRKLLAFDKEKSNVVRMVALSRAARWADIKLPPNEQGKTRIPAPRNNAFNPIINALANSDNIGAFMLGEALFMEGAMHFNLDLQAMQLTALKGLNNTVAVNQLELNLYQLISRFPQLSQLTYDDASNFCSAKTKEIISDITAQFSSSNNAVSIDDEVLEQAENTAKEWVNKSKLENALAELNRVPANTAYERAKVMLIKAKMCLLSERYDFAAPMLKELNKLIDEHELGQWQPDFSMQVWRNSVLCFDTLSTNGNDALKEQSTKLKQKMILTQPEIALGWI